jgi:hypothetical protein
MFGMFSEAGNNKVANIVADAQDLANVDSVEAAWNYAKDQLSELANNNEFEEAEDTVVRGAVLERLLIKN